jgi:hypothetical protein
VIRSTAARDKEVKYMKITVSEQVIPATSIAKSV